MAISQNFPEVRPSLNLNFARSKTLDPRITFTRASIGTYVGADGLIKTAAADEARFDHNPETGESLGLLIEESRTNLFTNSTRVPSAVTGSTTITYDYTISPDGTSNATRIQTTTGYSYKLISSILGNNTTFSYSLFVKQVSGLPFIRIDGAAGTYAFYLSFSSGTPTINFSGNSNVTVTSTKVIPYPNNWYKIESIISFSGSPGYTEFQFYRFGSDPAEYYVWGAQLEAGAFPTSYIPTSGSTVTRQPDNASITGTNFTDFYNSSEGTAFVKVLMPNNNGAAGIPSYAFKLTSDSNRYYGFSRDSAGPYHYVNTSNLNTFTRASLASEYKSALAIKENDINSYVNGNQNLNSTNVTLFVPDILYLGNIAINNLNILNGHIKSFVYYPERLTNAQLQNLTK